MGEVIKGGMVCDFSPVAMFFFMKFILSAGFRFVLLKFRKSLTDFTQDGKFHQRDWKVNKELKSIFLVRYFMMSVFWVDNTDWTKFKYKNPPLRV